MLLKGAVKELLFSIKSLDNLLSDSLLLDRPFLPNVLTLHSQRVRWFILSLNGLLYMYMNKTLVL